MEKCVLEFKVVPGASRTEIADVEGNVIRIRVAAPPEKGKANKELLRFLAQKFCFPKSNVMLLSGETSRRKRVVMEGLSEKEAQRALLKRSRGK
tara:strand:+ start:150 stop:431 length:282 start_codon:yes stop_codon:yes gene_type:complete